MQTKVKSNTAEANVAKARNKDRTVAVSSESHRLLRYASFAIDAKISSMLDLIIKSEIPKMITAAGGKLPDDIKKSLASQK